MHALHLTISGIPINLTADSSRLIDIFAEYFRYYIFNDRPELPSQASGTRIKIELISVDVLPDRSTFLPPEVDLVSRAGAVELWGNVTGDGDLFLFLTPGAAYEIRPKEGRIHGVITPQGIASPHILANTWTLFPLLLVLRAQGRYHLHAAAALSPDDKLWLICGPQGAGKTTFTCALGLAGWRPIADDSVILREGDHGLVVEALKKKFHLSRDLLKVWNAYSLGREVSIYDDRVCIDGLGRFSSLDQADRVYDRVDGILLTEITGHLSSRLLPVSMSEALVGLAEESTFFPIWSDHVQRHWNLLSRMAVNASAFRLSAGTDIMEDPLQASVLLTNLHFVDRM